MFLKVEQLLSEQEIAQLRAIAARAKFVDGRISNPHNISKKNLQLDTPSKEYEESSSLLTLALRRSPEFTRYCFFKRFAPPLLCRYAPGMAYGAHPDAAYINTATGPLRSDVSCTIFLSDPSTYEGGELRIHLGDQAIDIKMKAGGAVVYPSTTIHEVVPVRTGERLVAITFIESQICEEKNRDLLFQLNEVAALEGLNMDWTNRMRLEHVRHSLHRMWSS